MGWPGFHAVKIALQVGLSVSVVPPKVPPVFVKLVPSEKVYVSAVTLQKCCVRSLKKTLSCKTKYKSYMSSNPIQKSAGVGVLSVLRSSLIGLVLGAARSPPEVVQAAWASLYVLVVWTSW